MRAECCFSSWMSCTLLTVALPTTEKRRGCPLAAGRGEKILTIGFRAGLVGATPVPVTVDDSMTAAGFYACGNHDS